MMQRKVYRRSRIVRIFSVGALGGSLIGTGSAVVNLILSLLNANELSVLVDRGLWVLGSGIITAVATLIFLAGSTPQLILSNDGIEYRAAGYRLFAQWSDVERVAFGASFPGREAFAPEVLILRQSQLRASKWAARWLYWTGADRIIPIAAFNANWRRQEIGAYIRQYVPRL
jgi:hypothetical protein